MKPQGWAKVDAGRVFDIVFDVWLFLLCVGVLESCGCPTAYRWDGRDPPARSFYKVELCPNKPERVLCDSPDRLPNEGCR